MQDEDVLVCRFGDEIVGVQYDRFVVVVCQCFSFGEDRVCVLFDDLFFGHFCIDVVSREGGD